MPWHLCGAETALGIDTCLVLKTWASFVSVTVLCTLG